MKTLFPGGIAIPWELPEEAWHSMPHLSWEEEEEACCMGGELPETCWAFWQAEEEGGGGMSLGDFSQACRVGYPTPPSHPTTPKKPQENRQA